MTYTRAIGVVFGAAIDRIVRWLALSRIHPNVLTFLGLVINIVAAYLFAAGSFRWAGAVVIGAGLFDMVDGRVARLNVAIDVPSDSLKFEKIKGKLHGEANVLGIAYASDGSAAARFSDTVHFDFAGQKELDAFHALPLHYEKQLHIAPGNYTFKVVFSAGAESFGKMEAPRSEEHTSE